MEKAQIQDFLPQLERHYDALIAQTQEFPPDGSRPVTVCGRLCGWVSAAALQCLSELSGVKITDEAVHIAWADEPSPRVDHLLAHIADRKSTRLNSSHVAISYAVFCLKK